MELLSYDDRPLVKLITERQTDIAFYICGDSFSLYQPITLFVYLFESNEREELPSNQLSIFRVSVNYYAYL